MRSGTYWLPEAQAGRALRSAAGDSTVLGVVFVIVGLIFVGMLPSGSPAWRLSVILFNGIVLIAPGIWYVMTSMFLRRRQAWVVNVSLRVAIIQSAIVGLTLPWFFLRRSREFGAMIAPAMLAVFFMPALIALLFVLVRAKRMLNLLGDATGGFEAIAPKRVLQVDDPGGNTAKPAVRDDTAGSTQ